MESDFSGVKAALFCGEKLLVFLRDDKPGLRFANMWDFPGGGREGVETPAQCIQREVAEEFGIRLNEKDILWMKEYPAMHDPSLRAYFAVANISQDQVNSIIQTEGQKWLLMTITEFLSRDDAVPQLKTRLQDYLSR